MAYRNNSVAVIMPCFRVRRHVLSVIERMGAEVDLIFVVDDQCPEHSGDFVRDSCSDPRVQVIYHEHNQGVGGATLTGYTAALDAGADLLVKVDGDGQMDPALIPGFLQLLLANDADYAKGNRFFRLGDARNMPPVRLVGNLLLSFLTKMSSGYWHVIDPTNGFTALRADVARELPIDLLDKGYFFESDMLLHLNLLRAVVVDVPMQAVYGDEQSNLQVRKAFPEFFAKNLRNIKRRLCFSYFSQDFNLGSAELVGGLALMLFGIGFGGFAWARGVMTDTVQSSGTVMLAALPTLAGLQLLIAFLNFDVQNTPKVRMVRPAMLTAGQRPGEPTG